MRREILLFFIVLASFFVFYPVRIGQPRDIEQFMVTVNQEPAVFAQDEFAACLISNVNTVFMAIISKTNLTERKIIYFIEVLSVLFLLFIFVRKFTSELWAALLFLLFMTFNEFNYAGFHTLFFSYDFSGKFLAGAFVLLTLCFFIERRLWMAALAQGIAFYLHPGMGIWSLMTIISYRVVEIGVEGIWGAAEKGKKCIEFIQSTAVFLFVFLLVISPKLCQLLAGGSQEYFIDRETQLNIFKYGFVSQVSLFLAAQYQQSRVFILGILLTNMIFFILLIQHFKPGRIAAKLRPVFYFYIGTLAVVVLNEVLINTFNSHLCVYYGLVRVSGFNFMFLMILLSVMIVEVYRRRQYTEFFLWVLFMLNYSVLHYRNLSFGIQLGLLACITFVRLTKLFSAMDLAVERYLKSSKGRNILGKLLTGVCLLITLFIAARYFYKLGVPPDRDVENYRDAISYVNRNNEKRAVVLYPFDKYGVFFELSKNPGFFSVNYMVLFNVLYQYDPALQWKAYEKFIQLQQEFGIDTVRDLRKDPYHFDVPWRAAWSEKVDYGFVERWGKKYDIGYIIREKEYGPLPYKMAYENDGYRVYRRE